MTDSTPIIFVIDDDNSVRKSLDRLLRSIGYEVATFPSAEAFLASLTQGRADVLILDLRMPGMNGIELQRELRGRGSDAAIIFITAHDDDEAQMEAFAGGARAFIRKPFDDERLVSAIELILNRRPPA